MSKDEIKLYRFEEVLNDLQDGFILGDPYLLLQYKIDNNLPDDLLTEFTTQETGDWVVQNGIAIPMTGIENYPYTIYFNLSGETPELRKTHNQLQHEQSGYCLRVEHGRIYVYTLPYLQGFTADKIELLKKYKQATIPIQNGWYTVTILGGLTKQSIDVKDRNGQPNQMDVMEPTFEFVIEPTVEKPEYKADFLYLFKICEEL